ncbi:amidohydrolase family protein [Micromonospora sp. CPCC 206061]|uniref:amidohydrolase family protein n=1 Tax=Micromonospora sp. CPCC 206061 TaxID=3122410 RepID=UPI002FF213B2
MLAIRAARLFDGLSPVLVEKPTLLVADGRVAAVRASGEVPAGADVVDLPDATLLPGLIDAHTHLAFDASTDPVGSLASASDGEVLDGMRAAARTALAAGITTVRDLGDRDYLALRLREELAGESTSGPQVLAAGPPITTPRGHCWYLGGEAAGVDGVRAAVRAHAERGVDVIKVMASGGEMTPGTRPHLPQFGLDELRAAAEEAHRFGLPATAHAHSGRAIADAVTAGFDSIEHCSFMTEDGVEPLPDVIEAIARSGVMVCATLGVRPGAVPPPRIAARLEEFTALFRRMKQAGVTIVCSSDAGIGPSKPHDVLPYSVLMLIETQGWSAAEALEAATSRAARLCRVEDRKGRLAPGLDADILAVAGDPLTRPRALLDVAAVFREGHRVR